VSGTAISGTPNPLRAAFEARDIDLLAESLAEDVVLRSPIFSVPFEGKEQCVRLFAALYETLGEMRYELDEPGDPAVFAWRTDVNGEPLEGVDLVRHDSEGKVKEVTVFMRPLRGIAAFADATGPKLADGPGRRFLLRAAAAPPSLMMRALAGLGPRMVGLRRKPPTGD
jgi:SnoaL-like protein